MDYDDEFEFYDLDENISNSSLYLFSENKPEGIEKRIFGDTSLKVGIVVKVHEIEDEGNIGKKIPEYDVLVVQQDSNNSMEPVIYKNCINIDGFGGKADYLEYKLRKNPKSQKKPEGSLDTNFQEQFGSMVLLLCLDGSTDKGIIVKSVHHNGRKTTLTKDADIHLEGEYNGLNWQINKDGELTITFKSKTDNEGKPQDEESGGTTLKMDKEGSVDINTNLEGDEETYVRIDKKNKDIGLKAGQHIGFTAKKNVGINAEGEIKGSAKKDINFAAEGAAKFTSKSSLDLEGKSAVNIKGDSVMINGSNSVQIDGQSLLVKCTSIMLGSGGTPAVTLSTKFIGTGNKGAPVVCSAVGPFSSVVQIAN